MDCQLQFLMVNENLLLINVSVFTKNVAIQILASNEDGGDYADCKLMITISLEIGCVMLWYGIYARKMQ